MKNLQNSKATLVFKYFQEISDIPRGSGNEKQISDYLADFANKLGLEVIQDKALNIIIKKPATKGYEQAPTVIIQGHMDMVCEKNIGTDHDFEKDPLKLEIKGDKIYAKGTTLGADDGIAVAYAMAILTGDKIEHPALEVLITTDEEAGMTGAIEVSKDDIKGKILINLDTEEEGFLLVSSAGGIRTSSCIKVELESMEDEKIFHIEVRGLRGGHSGSDIHKGRGNANKLLGRVLQETLDNISLNLVSISGGSKNNAIPREADAFITVREKEEEKLFKIVNNFNEIFKNEFQAQDSGVIVSIKEEKSIFKNKFTNKCTEKVINLLYLYPNGVNTMSANIDGLTESSTNLGVLGIKNNEVEFDSAVRSSVPSLKEDIVSRMKLITEIIGGTFTTNAGYPAWEYKKDSKIRELCIDVYKKHYNEDPQVYAIHAGVECGLFEEILGSLDMISFGPDIMDAHTPQETLSISSTERVWEYLVKVLKNIDNNY
ncbi:aminoacyl-histidine dipeptidase [Clostridium vincentii]|uniref:Cytosol non-specific dipeptidase n=1 Tax=Clostridium vincentii TaxID=52704 RepID=A0A2T0BF05_9CLOT|nr:aminoacyl-histidine dipeptidase [Clostridium vincentii]PRR82448.1 Cytosol non-specific dipeptidase [Clostridium vincentii]